TGALYYSADGGASWGSFPHPRDGANVTCLALAILPDGSEHLYVGTDGDGIFRTADGGKSFAPANSGLDEKSVVGITASPHYATDGCLYAATWQNGVYRSTDRGESWALESDGLTKHIQADTRKVPHFYTIRLPGGFDGEKPVYLGAYDGLFESTNGGETWAERPTLGLDVLIDLDISPDYANDGTLMFSTYWFGAMLSHDAGKTWKPLHPQTEFD
ncbi:MAG: hypothetical protein KDN05_25425, partial [Verrucomicrobiae bacterium]|nr:hypothetical protein [Verrucomicrobiae bacterium]